VKGVKTFWNPLQTADLQYDARPVVKGIETSRRKPLVSPHQSTADLETGSASKMSHRAYASALVLLVGLATCAGAAADDLAGRVVRIIDGDTLVLLVKEGGEERQEKIPPWTRLSTRPLRTARVPSAAAFGSIRTRCRRGSGGAG